MSAFETTVSGKWILAGEHAVLRGSPALVFPLHSKNIVLNYEPDPHITENLDLKTQGEHGEDLRLLFWGVVEKALVLKKLRRNQVTGSVTLISSLPVGAGLGASAALCVAVSRFFLHLNFITQSEMHEFARQLENLFHGESSGLDIAVAMSGQPLRFKRLLDTNSTSMQPVPLGWQPHCYLSYSGQRGMTLDCITKVKSLFNTDPVLAHRLDAQMKKAVELCEESLTQSKNDASLEILKQAFDLAYGCFDQWGLISAPMQAQMNQLLQNGALAVKPTGSGSGGFILSLWKEKPSAQILKELTPCF